MARMGRGSKNERKTDVEKENLTADSRYSSRKMPAAGWRRMIHGLCYTGVEIAGFVLHIRRMPCVER